MSERRRKRALITRPQEDSADAAIALARRGITPVLAPMMQIEYATPDIEKEISLAQAILFTSRNGVRAFSRLSPTRDIRVLAVGDSTAALAREMGFVNVESAQGDSADLARLTIDRLKPADGLLFHAAGKTVAGDMSEALNKAGFKTIRRTLYDAKAVDALAEDTVTALRDRTLDYVLFFSPRTGRIFADLVEKAGLAGTCDSLKAICLSDAVASEIGDIDWREVIVAQQPTTTALLSVIGKLDDSGVPVSETGPKSGPETDTDKRRTPVEQSAAPDEDGGKPEEDAMTDTDASRKPSDKTPDPDDKTALPENMDAATAAPETAAPETADTGGPEEKKAAAQKTDSDSAEMRDAAAALSAVLASAPAAAEAGGKSRIGTVLVTVAAIIVVLGAGYASFPYWRDRLPPVGQEHLASQFAGSDALQEEIRALRAQVADLSTELAAKENALAAAGGRVAEIESKAAELNGRLAASESALNELRAANTTTGTVAAQNAALTQRVEALTEALDAEKTARAAAEAAAQKAEALALERATTAGRIAETLDNANGRIAGLEKNLEAARKAAVIAGRTDTIAMAARKLRDALDSAAPFGAEIASLKQAAGETPAVAAAIGPVQALASGGIPTRSELFARLPAAVAAAIAADRRPKEDGWIDRAMAKLTGFVTVRRIDGKGAGVDAIVARAELSARKGDLSGAVAEMSSLTGAAAEVSAGWVKAAQNRLAADRARAALDKIVLTGVTAGDPS
jgi:uroporphyrinogen-III synthase